MEQRAAAVTGFLTGLLLDNPHRVGQPLTRELDGYHSARRGPYRVSQNSRSAPSSAPRMVS
jgi:mRNA interferase RelE/StbE